MLESYVSAAALSADDKIDKHLPGCVELGRSFIPFVFSSLGGVGPAIACDYLDSIFSPSLVSELLSGGNGQQTAHRRLLFMQSLQAVICRASTLSLIHI